MSRILRLMVTDAEASSEERYADNYDRRRHSEGEAARKPANGRLPGTRRDEAERRARPTQQRRGLAEVLTGY